MDNQKFSKIIKIIVGAIIVILIILLLRGCEDKAKLELLGSNEMMIYQNDRYIEPGYNILETNNPEEFYVNVDGFVNTNKTGTYTLEYSLYNKKGKAVSKAVRTVTVLEDTLSNISMYIKGEQEEYFFIDTYVDHGIEAYNKSDDITNNVYIDSNVNPSVAGDYQVKYQVYSGTNIKEVIRIIHIVDFDIEEDIDEKNLMINLDVNCDDYYYTILPDGTRSYSRYVSYDYNEIGEYEFDIHLKNDSHKKHVVTITTIDREGPVGTCTLYYDHSTTIINVNATDASGIGKYSYNGLDFYTSSTKINSLISNVTVKVYDKHDNETDIKCKAELEAGFRKINVTEDGRVKNKSGHIKCGTSVAKENAELDLLMQSYGYKTRAAVAAAATYLANYKYDIPYFWGGKTVAKGLDPTWGCRRSHSTAHNCSVAFNSDKSACAYGLDCGGLVRWAYVQAGFDTSILRGEDIVTQRWGTFNPKQHKYNFNTNNLAYANQLKPGDLVHRTGHIGVIIGVDKDTVQVAEMLGPLFVSTVDKYTGRGLSKQKGFTEFVLMDEFFKTYGAN